MITNDPSPRSEIGSALVPMLGLCTVVLVTGALSVAESVFAPLAFGLFVIAIVWPLQKRLQVGLPRLLALALTMAATILVVVVFTLLIAWAAGRVGRFIVSDAARLQALYGSITAWLEGHGIALAGLWTDYFSVDQLIRLAQRVTAGLNSAVTFSVVVFIYVLLGLLEVDDARLKLGAWRHGKMGEVLLAGSTETAIKLRRYMLVRTLMSAVTGLLVWAFARLTGLPLAAEWGVTAFALNFIPFIGPFIATVFPTLFAMAQFEVVADGRSSFSRVSTSSNSWWEATWSRGSWATRFRSHPSSFYSRSFSGPIFGASREPSLAFRSSSRFLRFASGILLRAGSSIFSANHRKITPLSDQGERCAPARTIRDSRQHRRRDCERRNTCPDHPSRPSQATVPRRQGRRHRLRSSRCGDGRA